MKHLLASVLLLTAFPGLSWSASGPAFPIVEITAADIQTLVGIHSSQISILGFHLGMSRQKAEATLAHSETLLAFQDAWNPTRIYVYERTPAGEKGAALLYLIWDGIDESLRRITVFQGFRRYLPANFKRLLTMEAIDNTFEGHTRWRLKNGPETHNLLLRRYRTRDHTSTFQKRGTGRFRVRDPLASPIPL